MGACPPPGHRLQYSIGAAYSGRRCALDAHEDHRAVYWRPERCRVPRRSIEMGRGQAVRRGTLDPVFEGSNPSAPTNPVLATYVVLRVVRPRGDGVNA